MNYCPFNMEILGATLLSIEEARTFLTVENRAYSKYWWLRTPGYSSSYACYVSNDGYVDNNGGNVNHNNVGVRPALIINLESSDFKVGDVFEFGGKEFKIISPTLAWMHNDDIGCYLFRKNCEADEPNDYEASDVKKFVDDWFESQINHLRTFAEEESKDLESVESEDKLTCHDCAHYDVCVIMENSADGNKENYLVDFGCENYLEKSLDVKPGQKVYFTYEVGPSGYIIKDGTVLKTLSDNDGDWFFVRHIVSLIVGSHTDQWYRKSDIGENIFLSREAVEEYIKARKSKES